MFLLLLMLSCTPEGAAPVQRPDAVDDAQANALSLTDTDMDVTFNVPDSSRPLPIDEKIPVNGPWTYTGRTRGGMHTYQAPLPFKSRALFFMSPQAGLVMKNGKKTVPYDRFGKHDSIRWSHDRNRILVYRPKKAGPPNAGQLHLEYPKAVEREKALNFQASGEPNAAEFAVTSIADGWETREGLLLPAPATATWKLDVPAGAELTFYGGIVAPEINTGASDGATLTASIDGQTVLEAPLALGFQHFSVDLSEWANTSSELVISTDPGATTDFDYVFLAEPRLASRQKNPRRVIMAFIDTLRPDHLSLYGYERDTSKAIDHLKDKAAVFDNARSIAPWTLPSARTVVTGKHPEHYAETQTVQGVLSDEGWATAFFAGNVYLGSNFDMHRDWDLHRIGLWPGAQEVTDGALKWLEEHEGKDAIIQVHYMDPHLPYIEPSSHRNLYAGKGVGPLREEFHLSDVRKARIKKGDTESIDYIKGRYDNNIRYATDQIARLVATLDDNDVFVLYADHGEEFWDHNGFEHGHTLKDELLRVPLLIMGPGVNAGAVSEPVSLLDITPTILDILKVEDPEKREGLSLVKAANGDPSARAELTNRPQAFGRPLYGVERWGVLSHGKKWTTHEGREALYDVANDPKETSNLLIRKQNQAGEYVDKFSEAIRLPANMSYRLMNSRFKGGKAPELKLTCVIPGGIKSHRVGNDYLERSDADVSISKDAATNVDTLTVTWPKGRGGMREIYFTPHGAFEDLTKELDCSATEGAQTVPLVIGDRVAATPGDVRVVLGRVVLPNRLINLTWGITPYGLKAMQTMNDENREALEQMGYVEIETNTVHFVGSGWTKLSHSCGNEPVSYPIEAATDGRQKLTLDLQTNTQCTVNLQGPASGTATLVGGFDNQCSASDGNVGCRPL